MLLWITMIAVIVLFLVLGVLFMRGKCIILIEGVNTMEKSRREKLDRLKIGRFAAIVMFLLAFWFSLLTIGYYLDSNTVTYTGVAGMLLSLAVAVLYGWNDEKFMQE